MVQDSAHVRRARAAWMTESRSPRHLPHDVPVLPTSSTTLHTDACHVILIHHTVYWCSRRDP